MLSANELTINPSSGLILISLWILSGVAVGFVTGAMAGRIAPILRRPPDEAATLLAVMTTGHLFLAPGLGLAAAGAFVLLRLLRARLFPRHSRLDLAAVGGLGVLAIALPLTRSADPPALGAGVPLDEAAPLPGSVPVTLTIRTADVPFPEVPAMHVALRPLDSAAPGRLVALRTGRLPDRTRVGRSVPRILPGGGGVSRGPDAPGTSFLLAHFPAVENPWGTPFEPPGDLLALAASANLPVLTEPPSDGDPPMYLRVLTNRPLPREAAERIARESAWIDVRLDGVGGGVALAGPGLRLTPASGEVNLIDLTPTVLHLLGLAIPRSVDGRVLTELLDSPGPADRPPRYRALVTSDGRNEPGTRES